MEASGGAGLKLNHILLSYPDCFEIATACYERATIITGDQEFKLVEKSVNIEWM